MKEIGEYYLGLDIGTSSVGWAVTDSDYNILEYRRKALWGIHLFNEGETAAKRRMQRCARRRLDRKNQRLILLRELMSEEIFKVDPSFFERLDESWLHYEDKKTKQPYSLFNDPGFNDKDFHKKFPTIYHLRRYLIDTDEKPDIRLIYLALHHIIKHRGHFLFVGLSEEDIPPFSDVFELLTMNLSDCGIDIAVTNPNIIAEILKDRQIGVNDKKKKLLEFMLPGDDGQEAVVKAVVGLLAGATVKLSSLFCDESIEAKLCFRDQNANESIESLDGMLTEDQLHMLRLMKQLYDWSILSVVMKDHRYISEAKIESYEAHRRDLTDLKRAFSSDRIAYNEMFKSPSIKGNYCSYSGSCSKGSPVRCTRDDFYDYVKKKLEGNSSEAVPRIMERIERDEFMPKQHSSDNAILPYCVHLKELRAILDNISKWYPFMGKSEDGMTVAEKIVSLLKFRIPYYVGPLNDCTSNGGLQDEEKRRRWIVRRDYRKVNPWNFEDVVDLDASAEAFMRNLTNYCTYLVGEPVLPKNSVLYSYYSLYNELNNIRVDGEKLSVPLKRCIVRDLFENYSGNVTEKGLKRYLKKNGYTDDPDISITGMDERIKTTLRPINRIKEVIGNKANNRKLVESIIRIATIFSGSDRVKSVLEKNHHDVLTKDEIDKLSRMELKGWGRLSERFLTGLYATCRETGTEMNIIGMLEGTQDNLMEILYKYGFDKQIELINAEANGIKDEDIQYSDLDQFRFSPAVKKGIWRTMDVVRDVVGSIGHAPSKIFVETTRENLKPEKKKRTKSRKKELESLYRSCGEDNEWKESLKCRDDAELKSRSLYLYYTQLGKCMYCGKNIDLSELGDKDVVNLDHIYPQSKIKDDSIHKNLVLVHVKCNQDKGDRFPVDPKIQIRMGSFWKMLREKKYISSEKYSRLTRTDAFSDEELGRFISRQIVETSQSVKGTIAILKSMYGEADIVYVKAGMVSEFRHYSNMLKCRSVNDYHHAKDAYLNIVVGNVYDTKFTKDVGAFVRSHEDYNIRRMYDFPVSRNGIIAWIPGDDGTMATVRKYMRRDNILFVKHPFVQKGLLFNENLVRKEKCQKKPEEKIPRKAGMDVQKYGGYENERGACYSLVQYESRGKMVRSIEVLPITAISGGFRVDRLGKYFSEKLSTDVEVLVPIIRMGSLLEWDGFPVHIGGRTGDRIFLDSGLQLIVPDEIYLYCRKLYKLSEDGKQKIIRPASFYGINKEENLRLFDYFLDKSARPPYVDWLSNLQNNLVNLRGTFESADERKQAEVLNQILHSFQCNPAKTDLKLIGKGELARIRVSKTLKRDESVYLVNQSPSGLHTNKVRLSP